MSKYELLTKYIPIFEDDYYGKLVGNSDQLPYVLYKNKLRDFEEDVFRFVDMHPEMDLRHYYSIIEKNGIDMNEYDTADISKVDATCICALIVANLRAERFCDGVIMYSCITGTFKRWLDRLKELDN